MYVYQHRRYQEYFLTKKLKDEYEKKPKILRDLRVLSNQEYLEELFLKYLRREYVKDNNLAGLMELNLFNIYLGKEKDSGIQGDYLRDSKEFIPALVCQHQSNYDRFFEELKIRDKIALDMNEISIHFTNWENNQDYCSTDYLIRIWEGKIAPLIRYIVDSWKGKKYEFAEYLIEQLEKIISLYKEKNFFEKLDGIYREQLNDPFWEEFENWIYYQLIIKKENVTDVFDNLIRKRYEDSSGENSLEFEEYEKKTSERSFFRVCLNENKIEMFNNLKDLSESETITFLELLTNVEYLHVFNRLESLHQQIKVFVGKLSDDVIKKNPCVLFYKKFFNIVLSQLEVDLISSILLKVRKKNVLDVLFSEVHSDFSLFSFILDECSYEKKLTEEGSESQVYDEFYLYTSLFREYILLLKKEKSLGEVIRDYIRYTKKYIDEINNHQNFKLEVSYLWAYIFSNSDIDTTLLVKWKDILIKEEYALLAFEFYKKLKYLDSRLYDCLINMEELIIFEESLLSWDSEYYSYVNTCFSLSILYSNRDINKSEFYFEKGINEGILRHGWRKDIIVSYLLTDAFKIIWRNNWLLKEDKEKYAWKVFDLNLKLADITNGDDTIQGPYIVLDIVAENDIKLAEQFKERLIKYRRRNSAITPILISKANQGFLIEEIQKGMEEYILDYDYEGIPRADYYKQKFKVYLAITKCDLYTDKEKELAFEKAYEQTEEIKRNNIKDAFQRALSLDEKQIFRMLCNKYGKTFSLENDQNKKTKKKPEITESEFEQEVKKCKTKMGIQEKYKQLSDYNNGIVLTKYESWEILIEKTFEINSNIKLLLEHLKENYYPGTDYWTSNTKYFHLAMAAALKSLDTRQETLNYLYEYSGHGGFVNVMKSYDVLEDKENCLSLFNRYIKFCELIVY
ncbi:hypothetical protein [Bacillus toyonensis]|uniref:hypothetical protein n=1 Tax=Bacillus toyonensis TaxID=155322 RepID=UPI0011563C2D|nr:hypothetical protein [Bacillus toyonensis]